MVSLGGPGAGVVLWLLLLALGAYGFTAAMLRAQSRRIGRGAFFRQAQWVTGGGAAALLVGALLLSLLGPEPRWWPLWSILPFPLFAGGFAAVVEGSAAWSELPEPPPLWWHGLAAVGQLVATVLLAG